MIYEMLAEHNLLVKIKINYDSYLFFIIFFFVYNITNLYTNNFFLA